jgi:hypothetical protein
MILKQMLGIRLSLELWGPYECLRRAIKSRQEVHASVRDSVVMELSL